MDSGWPPSSAQGRNQLAESVGHVGPEDGARSARAIHLADLWGIPYREAIAVEPDTAAARTDGGSRGNAVGPSSVEADVTGKADAGRGKAPSLPSWEACDAALQAHRRMTALEQFVLAFEPAAGDAFRSMLAAVVEEARRRGCAR